MLSVIPLKEGSFDEIVDKRTNLCQCIATDNTNTGFNRVPVICIIGGTNKYYVKLTYSVLRELLGNRQEYFQAVLLHFLQWSFHMSSFKESATISSFTSLIILAVYGSMHRWHT